MSSEGDGCPEAIGSHSVDRLGKCYWCGRKVTVPVAMPRRFDPGTRLGDAYQYFYNPDWGGHNERTYT